MSVFAPIDEPLSRPLRLAVLISGGGTTLENLHSKIAAGELSAEVCVVIAGNDSCRGIKKAEEQGLRAEVVPRSQFVSVADFSRKIFDLCREADVDLVVLAGFLSLIEIPEDFRFRVMNIHPALIPSFCGRGFFGHHVHEAVLDRGAKVSGCTVHFADNEYDHGPIILQIPVPVLEDDDPGRLATRVFQAECEAYPQAIRLFADGRLQITDRRVRILPAP